MKTLTLLFVTVAVLALPAQAAIITNALEMTLTCDAAGNVTLMNNTGTALNVDGLEILSVGNCDPVGWVSIADSVLVDPVGVMTALGAGALSFGELTGTSDQLAEGNLSNSALFQPGAQWSIGKPLMAGTLPDDLLFYYSKPGIEGDKFLGVVVPEPATMALLLVGLPFVMRRRKRK